jgi:hypothetical protein
MKIYLEYGECPSCGQKVQPENSLDDINEEWCECEVCRLQWSLFHEDKNDKRDENEVGRKYRVGEITRKP